MPDGLSFPAVFDVCVQKHRAMKDGLRETTKVEWRLQPMRHLVVWVVQIALALPKDQRFLVRPGRDVIGLASGVERRNGDPMLPVGQDRAELAAASPGQA